MKVLFIGHYREKSGWGQATKDYLLALDAVGVDVVARPVLLGLAQEATGRIKELEEKSSKGCTHCIQAVLPDFMEYNGRFKKCVGIYIPDTYNIEYTHWYSKLQLMDEIWSSASDASYEFPSSRFVPVPFNQDELIQKGQINIQELNGNFTFYFIGDYNRRKHIAALLRAFHTEFHRSEPVKLLIKTSKFNTSPQVLSEEIHNLCTTVKNHLRIYPNPGMYIPEAIITDYLSHDELIGLHAACDCFVMPSFGEGWCIPAFHAMYLGKTPIVSNIGGMKQYINASTGWVVKGRMSPVFGHDDAMPNTGSSYENWFDIDIRDLQLCMREAYEQKSEQKRIMQYSGKIKALEFTYEQVGNKMKRFLEK